jgi:uncharacterized membrane protein YcaP (DUF421 family)
MEAIIRGAAVYLVVWVIFRLAGKRTLAQITTFDVALLLIISEATQPALTDSDHSFTNMLLLILTMIGLDVALSLLKRRFPGVDRIVDGTPLLILDSDGLKQTAMDKERVTKEDILHAARDRQGLGSLDDVQFAVLEPTGEITVIPKRN